MPPTKKMEIIWSPIILTQGSTQKMDQIIKCLATNVSATTLWPWREWIWRYHRKWWAVSLADSRVERMETRIEVGFILAQVPKIGIRIKKKIKLMSFLLPDIPTSPSGSLPSKFLKLFPPMRLLSSKKLIRIKKKN